MPARHAVNRIYRGTSSATQADEDVRSAAVNYKLAILAQRALTRLPEKVAAAVVEFLYGSLAASPHRVGKPLKLSFEGLHSARRGDYRVVYRSDDQRCLVTVIAIEHRSDIYRPRRL